MGLCVRPFAGGIDMGSVNELEKKLSIAREIEKIKNIFNNAQCPACGCTGIEVKITISGA